VVERLPSDGATRPVIAAVSAGWPRRIVVVGLTFLGCVIAYTDRVNISVAAVAMQDRLAWSQTQKGLVLSAFFVGYLLFMFPAGLLARHLGGKRVLGLAVFGWSLFTILTPIAATLSIVALLAVRIAMGVGEAAMFPAAYELFGRWVPSTERGRAVAAVMSGVPAGTLIGLTGAGWLVQQYGWPMAFYVFGVVGFIWVLVWTWQIENDPSADRHVGAEERVLLSSVSPQGDATERPPLRRLLLRAPSLAIIAAHFATTWNLYVLLSWLPSYFRDVHKLSIAGAGLLSAAPWVTSIATSNLIAVATDRLIRRGANRTAMRKFVQCTALLGTACLLLLLPQARSAVVALALLCAAVGALTCFSAGFAAGVLDVAPRSAAVLYGFSNTFATVPGIVGVTATGWLIDLTGTYTAAFTLAAAISAAGALLFGWLFEAREIER
jgi:MFS transporter, ACS family, solute carrier family 17 (sodium-dependent inorganic phosphate cotransporter), other